MTTDEEIVELKAQVQKLHERLEYESSERIALTKIALAELHSERETLRKQGEDASGLAQRIAEHIRTTISNEDKILDAVVKLSNNVGELIGDYSKFKSNAIGRIELLQSAAETTPSRDWRN